MDAEKLVALGFTKREAHAYFALLELEEAKAGEIAQRTHEDRTNIYDSLKSLVKKGLVSYVVKDHKTYYRVASPEKLFDYLKEKEKSLQDIYPYLMNIYKSFKPKPVIETYEGREGLKTVLNNILRESKDLAVFGASDRMYYLFPEYTARYLKERERKKIHARQFYAKGDAVLPSKYSTFKAIPKEFSGPATTIIYGDNVAIFLWFIELPIVIHIKSKEAAKAYRNQFEFMWRLIK